MLFILKKLGEFIEFLKGPGITVVNVGDTVHKTVIVAFESGPMRYEIISQRITYKTKFSRVWIPSVRKAVFEVQGRLYEANSYNLDPRLTEKVTFPNLCNFTLLDTDYPHVRAIGAYLDRVGDMRDAVTFV